MLWCFALAKALDVGMTGKLDEDVFLLTGNLITTDFDKQLFSSFVDLFDFNLHW